MPYCQECGLFNRSEEINCSSCGSKLIPREEAVKVEEPIVNEPGANENQAVPEQLFLNPEASDGTLSDTQPLNEATGSELEALSENEKSDFFETSDFRPDIAEQETACSPTAGDSNSSPTEIIEGASTMDETPEPELVQNEVSQIESSVVAEDQFSRRQQTESQLGKGIIKPTTVELSSNGTHFKYDEPPQNNFIKAEPINEKAVELRVVNSAPEPGGTESEPSRVTAESLNQSIVVETDSTPSDTAAHEAEVADGTQTESADSAQKPEPAAEAVSEPGLQTTVALPKVHWEGNRTWLGFSLKEHYRILGEQIQILKPGQTVLEFNLDAIRKIDLKQSWLERIFDVGSLWFVLASYTKKVPFLGIKRPQVIKKLLEELKSE